MDGFAFFDIIFIAMVAAFLVLRLRSVLGRRTGEENPERWQSRPRPVPTPVERTSDKVVPLPGRESEALPAPQSATPLDAGLTQIRVADPSFDPRGFLGGARGAFELIVGAFAQGDTGALRPLLADDVYENFAGAIRERQKQKHTLETTLVATRSADILEARMESRTALVTVKFVTEQVNVTRDANGAIVDGDPNLVTNVTDVWTFSRNTRSRDPNWLLTATAAPQ